MAIDRAFTIAGHGTVVTGSVSRGEARTGDQLRLEPGGVTVRVRGLQNHDLPVDVIHRGQRAAINLAGVHHEDVVRGQELCWPGHLVPSRLITADLSLLPTAPRPLKNRARVRVHVGAAEILAAVVLLDRDQLLPGESAAVQLFLRDPAVVTWNQAFVIRSESPVITIGGGRVLNPNAEKLRSPSARQLEMVADLKNSDPVRRASAALYFAGLRDWQAIDLVRTAGIEDVETVSRQLAERGDLIQIDVSPTRTLRLHRAVLEEVCQRVESVLEQMHDQNPLRSWLERAQLASRFHYLGQDEAVFNLVLETMRRDQRIRLSATGVALVGRGPRLSQNEQKLLEQLVETFRGAGLQSPSVKECQQQASKNQSSVPQLLELAVANGQLIRIAPDYYLHADVEQAMRQRLHDEMRNRSGLTMSEIREILNTSRKFSVPFCEYLDRIGFTQRDGDLRVLATDPQLAKP
jgi:selenocysteine-specific elongation factor